MKAYLFRGATHYLTPQDAGGYLALRASSRMWELPSWVSYYGLAPEDWPRFREYVRTALENGPLTRSELAAALGRSRRYRHLRGHVTDGNAGSYAGAAVGEVLPWMVGLGEARTSGLLPKVAKGQGFLGKSAEIAKKAN